MVVNWFFFFLQYISKCHFYACWLNHSAMSSSAFSNQNGLFCPWPKTLATRVELCRRGPLHDASYSRTMEYDDVPFGKRRSSSFESTKFQPKFWYNSIQVIFENYHHVLSCIWIKIFQSLKLECIANSITISLIFSDLAKL